MKPRKKPSSSNISAASSEPESAQQVLVGAQPSPQEATEQVVDVSLGEAPENDTHGCVALERGTDAACNEIRQRHRALTEAGRRGLEEAIELGALLFAVKERLPHGRWYPFLEDAEIGTRVAQNYLRLYHHRDEVRPKSALSADLTIVASLNAIRTPKQKRVLSERVGEANRERIVSIPQETLTLLNDGKTGFNGAAPSTTLDEQSGDHEGESKNGHAIFSVLESDSAKSDAVEITAGVTGDNNATMTAGQDVHPVAHAIPATLTSEISGETSASNEPDGFLAVDGTRLPHNRWDDGTIPFKWVQMQVTAMKWNNDNAKDENRRCLLALKIEQDFLIELARTSNRIIGTAEETGEPLIEILNGTIFRLRNFTNELARRK